MRQSILFCLLAGPALAAPFTLSTGSAGWQVAQTAGASNNGAALNTSTAAVVLTGTIPTSLPSPFQWASPSAGSAWIGQLATDGNFQNVSVGATPGTYQYSLTFGAGFGGSFSFAFGGDNSVSLTVVQGASTLFSGSGGFASPLTTSGSINYGAGGNIVFTAIVVNGNITPGDPSRNPSGFLVSGFGDSLSAPVPEPATCSMIGLGVVAVLVTHRRRQGSARR